MGHPRCYTGQHSVRHKRKRLLITLALVLAAAAVIICGFAARTAGFRFF